MGNKLFGTDGVRGVANQYPMTAEFALKLGMAAGELICTNKRKAAIGIDTRVSGEMLEAALAAGFMAAGVEVLKLGIIPTPALTSIVSELDVDMAVMITASHNPYYDNGIKLINAKGDKFSDEETAKVEAAVFAEQFVLNSEKIGRVTNMPDVIALYLDKVMEAAGEDAEPLKGLRVVLDCANGAFYKIMPEVFKQLGAGVIVIGNEPDGYNINRECGSQHVEKMLETVKNAHAQLGIACDGDGDRIVVCDERGQRINSDQLIAFLAKYFKDSGKLKAGTVVATIVSNPALDRYLNSEGLECVRTSVGERYVIAKMKELGANVGGEESGHVVLTDYSQTGDALIVALTVCQGLLKSGKKMSEIFPLFQPMLKKRIDCHFISREEMAKAYEQPAFQNVIAEAEKEVQGKGKILVRKSGTEPAIQLWVWGDDAKLVEAVNAKLASGLSGMKSFTHEKVMP